MTTSGELGTGIQSRQKPAPAPGHERGLRRSMLDKIGDIGLEARETTGRVTALPASASEVSSLIRLAGSEGWLVAPDWLALQSGEREVLSVSMERMDGISEVVPQDLMAVVGAGVRVGALVERAARDELCWPMAELLSPDAFVGDVFSRLPGSWTMEGNLARRYLLTVEGVMADGSVLRAGARTVKSVTGYDIRQLLVGSRGVLGLVIGLTLRLEAKANLEMVIGRYSREFGGLSEDLFVAPKGREEEDGSRVILGRLKAELDPDGVFPSVDDAFPGAAAE